MYAIPFHAGGKEAWSGADILPYIRSHQGTDATSTTFSASPLVQTHHFDLVLVAFHHVIVSILQRSRHRPR
jgi:hypothetical protein